MQPASLARVHNAVRSVFSSRPRAVSFALSAGLLLPACGSGVGSGPLLATSAWRSGVLRPAISATYPYGDDLRDLMGPTTRRRVDSVGAGTDHFMIPSFQLPVEDQLDAGSCLYMAGTGILEWLINEKKAITSPQINGVTDLSERYLLTLASRISLQNNFTDVVYLFQDAGAYVLDPDLRFAKQDGSTMVNWTPVDEQALPRHTDLPAFGRKVLFTSNGDSHANGVMNDDDLATIKSALRSYASPVLFVFHPPTVNWWHADIIVGYDDAKQVFYTRDSAFGAKRADLPLYGYGTATTADDDSYLGIYELSYAGAKAWGNHASVYYLED